MAAPRPRVSGQGAGDGSLAGDLVRVDEDFLAFGSQPHSPELVLDDAVFGPEFARAQERHDCLVAHQEWAELFHEVQRQPGLLVGGRMRDAQGGVEPGGVQRAGAFGQEDGVPVGQGSVGQVAGWTPSAPVEGDVAGPGGPRVDADAGEAFSSSIYWAVRSVTRAPVLMAAAAMVSIASVRRCSVGAASMRVVPTRE